jgi:hypothetical protein
MISTLLNSGVDIDEYVPKETKDWCITQLSTYGIDLNTLSGGDTILGGARAHVQAYQCLRDIVRRHILSGMLPILSESRRPTGGYQAAEAQGGMLSELLQDNAQFVRTQEDLVFMQNIENCFK